LTRLVELRAGAARALIAPETGAALAALEHGGVPVLRPTADDAVSAGRVRDFACYPLVPYSNRIAGATLHWDGVAHALARNFGDHPHAIHGNGWQRAWHVVHRDTRQIELELTHQPTGAHASEWPFAYRALQRYTLDADALEVALTLANTDTRSAPAGLGWHPYFPRDAQTTLQFSARGAWLTDDTRLPTAHVALPLAWDFAVPRAISDTVLDNVFTSWQPPARLRQPQAGLAVTVNADRACAFLVVYVPPARDFLAVEPVTHMTDAFNRASSGETDTGTRRLAPGETFSCTMRLGFERIG
jgi:aldose 1-epimerase